MSKIQQYINYIRAFAVAHPQLLHQDESGKRTFKSISLEEAFHPVQGVREKGFLLQAILPFISHQEDFKYYEAGFIICNYAKPNSPSDFERAMRETDSIADELLHAMRSDSRAGHELFEGSMNQLSGIEVRPHNQQIDPNYYGWMITFSFFHEFKCLP